MDSNELSVKLDGTLRRIRDSYIAGRIDDAGRDIRVLAEIILFSLKEAAGLDTSGPDIYVSIINGLSSGGLIDNDEKGKLHHLKNISNTFMHSSAIERQGSPEEREKLAKYRRDFQRCISFCEKEAEWAHTKFEELKEQFQYNGINSSGPENIDNSLARAIEILDRDLKTMEFNIGVSPDSAGSMMREIFETILSVLAGVTQVSPDPQEVNEKGDKIAVISALARQGWISQSEEDNLHHLRTTANLFAHATRIEIENNSGDIVKLNEARRNIRKELRLCTDMVEWTKNRVSAIANGSFRPRNSFRAAGNRRRSVSEDGRPAFLRGIFNYVLPFLFCIFSTFGTVYFLRHSNFIQAVEKTFTSNDYSGLSVKTHIIACVIMLLAFILFFDITFPAAAGCLFFLLTRSATGSDLCAGLTAALVIIMTLRYPLGLKKIFGAVTHFFWILTAEIISVCILVGHFRAAGQQIDRYIIGTRILPVALGFILLYVIGTIVVNSVIGYKPFEQAMENYNVAENRGFIPFAAVLGANVYLFHKTWAKGLVFVSRNYYDSPALFWVIHFIIGMMVIYILFALYAGGGKKRS